MVSIEKCFPNRSFPEQVKDGSHQPAASDSPRTDQSTGKGNRLPILLAKAAHAVRMQVISGKVTRGRTVARSGESSGGAEDTSGPSLKQDGFSESEMVRNLKGIVTDDSRWNLFALGALGLQPGSPSCEILRDELQKGFKEGTWEGFANLIASYSKDMSADEKIYTQGSTGDPSAGSIERAYLWLNYPGFYENMLTAIQKNNLPANPDLFTNPLLIRFVNTIEK